MTAAEMLESAFGTLPALIRAHAAERPERTAVALYDSAVSYAEFDGLVDRSAVAMQDAGVAHRDVIAICALSSIEYVAAFVAALRIGAAFAPLSASSSPEQLRGMIADCGAKLLFADSPTLKAIGFDAPTRIIALDGSPGAEAFEAFIAAPGARPSEPEISPDDTFNIIYSSGTTGAPKGIIQTHKMRWGHTGRGAIDGSSVTIASTPLYSNTTLVSVVPTLARGGTLALMQKFDARGFLELAQKVRATNAMLVPVQYRRIMDLPDFDSFDLSSFRMKTSTSAPFPAALKADVLKRWPGGLVEYYGMTEGGGTCVLIAHEHPDKLHTVGRPAPGHDIRLIDENGQEVPQGEMGEVVGNSPTIMKGYHNQPEKTREAEWYDETGKRFIRTGDVGRFDEDGFLILMDRKKDMIISGGFNVYPSDIEAVLMQHPDVVEAAVVGAASRAWGETPVAFVVPKAGASISESELKAWVNAQVGKTQRLAALAFKDVLPRSSIGKVLKRELRNDAAPLLGADAE